MKTIVCLPWPTDLRLKTVQGKVELVTLNIMLIAPIHLFLTITDHVCTSSSIEHCLSIVTKAVPNIQ